MKEVARTSRFVVWDDVLSANEFGLLMAHVSNQNFRSVHTTSWEKVWKLTDGQVFRTQSLYSENFPTNSPMDRIFELMMELSLSNPTISGTNPKDWNRLTTACYIYPKGTRIAWHGDGAIYTSAFTYYCHPRWSPHWGGELMVAQTPHENTMPKLDYDVSPGVDHSRYDAWISAYGIGQMVVPKPNRLVLMQGGTCHMVNRVDESAGDNLRMSVVGFTMVPQKEQNDSVRNHPGDHQRNMEAKAA